MREHAVALPIVLGERIHQLPRIVTTHTLALAREIHRGLERAEDAVGAVLLALARNVKAALPLFDVFVSQLVKFHGTKRRAVDRLFERLARDCDRGWRAIGELDVDV